MTEATGSLGTLPRDAWKNVDCGLCGNPERELKFEDGPFSVVICTRCGLTYVTPRLSDASLLADVYNETYWNSHAAKNHGYTDYRADEELYLKTYRRRMSVVRRHFPEPGRVLDVGCAAGFFLSVMRDAGCSLPFVTAPALAHLTQRRTYDPSRAEAQASSGSCS